ncbi:hypothetical protein [Pseudomonas sp. B33.4]|uniref:hypothetical protein n=1 Tax=Pseudomonas sp. B33.4 TaxID=3104265 RepID=UPI002ADEAFFD|nr:hypothetical protein [Pseudomonas sp. B33.4]
MGFMAGFFQDLIKPLAEDYVKSNAIKKPIAVELKSNRLTVGAWENNTDPTNGRSDVVTILSDRQPVKSIEIYHTAKDQRFKNYPPTSPLADSFIPTTAEYQITDLDGDGVNEIVVTLKNQLYSLHYDKQVNILIYGPTGELLTKTPYPQTIQNLEIRTLNPYSAYKTTAAMKDKISEKIESSTFANDFTLITTGDRKTLRFSWVIDSASYTAPHLHQVEEFEYSEGKLISVGAPKLFVSPFWDDATSGELVRSTQQAAEFLRENNLPDFVDMYKQMKEDSQEQAPELPKEG